MVAAPSHFSNCRGESRSADRTSRVPKESVDNSHVHLKLCYWLIKAIGGVCKASRDPLLCRLSYADLSPDDHTWDQVGQ